MALKIQVNADYKIISDSRNIIVQRRYVVDPTKAPNWAQREAQGADPTPRDDWRDETFHHNLNGALKWIVNQQIRDSDAETLNDLRRDIRRFHREISDVMRV